MTILSINVVGTSLQVDTQKLQPQVIDYILRYGLTQMLNDTHASLTAKVEADEAKRTAGKVALAEKKLASLLAGEVAQARVGGGGDPLKREMRRLAEAELTTALKAAGKKLADAKAAKTESGESVWTKTLEVLMAKHNERYEKAAKASLKARDSAAIDLEDLGL